MTMREMRSNGNSTQYRGARMQINLVCVVTGAIEFVIHEATNQEDCSTENCTHGTLAMNRKESTLRAQKTTTNPIENVEATRQ